MKPTVQVNLSIEDLELIRNNLRAVRVYRNTDIPHGVILWHPWMDALLLKINNAIHELELQTAFEERASP